MTDQYTYLVAWQIDGEAYAIFREGTAGDAYRLDCLKTAGWRPVTEDPLSQFLHRGAWEISEEEAREIADSYGLPFGAAVATAANPLAKLWRADVHDEEDEIQIVRSGPIDVVEQDD